MILSRAFCSALILSIVGTGGCIESTVRLYEGKPLPVERVSRLINADRAVVRSVDGRALTREKYQVIGTFELRPGRHRVVVGRPEAGDRARQTDAANRTFEFMLEPGRTYSFAVAEIRGGGIDRYDVRVVDYVTKKVVARPLDPSGREPGVRYD